MIHQLLFTNEMYKHFYACLQVLHVFVCGCEKVSVTEISQTTNQCLLPLQF